MTELPDTPEERMATALERIVELMELKMSLKEVEGMW